MFFRPLDALKHSPTLAAMLKTIKSVGKSRKRPSPAKVRGTIRKTVKDYRKTLRKLA